jgi:hypothetical protein
MSTSTISQPVNKEEGKSTMTAWRVHEFGPPSVLSFEQV